FLFTRRILTPCRCLILLYSRKQLRSPRQSQEPRGLTACSRRAPTQRTPPFSPHPGVPSHAHHRTEGCQENIPKPPRAACHRGGRSFTCRRTGRNLGDHW